MSKSLSSFILALAALCCATLMPASLSAQSLWLERRHERAFGLEVLKPNFTNDDAGQIITTNSGLVVFATLRLPVSGKILFVGELPFAHGSSETKSSFSSFNRSESQNIFGNPYLGFEITDRTGAFTPEFGVRVPVTPEDKFLGVITGLYADYDRLEAFLPDTLSVMTLANYRYRDQSGFALKLRGGQSLLFDTSRYGGGAELFISYSAQAGYESERFSILGGVTGRALLTEENASFAERSIHQLGFNASVGLGKVRPGVHFRLPLDDDLKNVIDSVLGVNLGVQF